MSFSPRAGSRRIRSRSVAGLLVLGALIGASAVCPAEALAGDDKPKPTKEEQAAAARKFKEGEKAFAKHDYATAAVAFEEAYTIAPHPDVLLNAIDSREKAGDLAAAATWCAHLMREYPNDKGRNEASQRLAKYRPKLGRLDVALKGSATNLTIDAQSAEPGESYVDPGDHLVSASFDGERIERNVNVVAGARATILLEHAPTKKPEPEVKPVPVARDEKPLHPAFFFVGLGLTAVSGGVLVWSGVDTNAARDEFGLNPTQEGLDEGRAKQTRTNVFIGVTSALGAATALIGIFAVEWGGSDPPAPSASVKVGVAPGGMAIQGVF